MIRSGRQTVNDPRTRTSSSTIARRQDEGTSAVPDDPGRLNPVTAPDSGKETLVPIVRSKLLQLADVPISSVHLGKKSAVAFVSKGRALRVPAEQVGRHSLIS